LKKALKNKIEKKEKKKTAELGLVACWPRGPSSPIPPGSFLPHGFLAGPLARPA